MYRDICIYVTIRYVCGLLFFTIFTASKTIAGLSTTRNDTAPPRRLYTWLELCTCTFPCPNHGTICTIFNTYICLHKYWNYVMLGASDMHNSYELLFPDLHVILAWADTSLIKKKGKLEPNTCPGTFLSKWEVLISTHLLLFWLLQPKMKFHHCLRSCH